MTPFHISCILTIIAAIRPGAAQITSEQAILSPQALPDGQIVTFDPSWFSDNSTDSTYILINGDLTITIPVPEDVDPPPALVDLSAAVVNQSLPSLLQLFGVDDSEIPALVDEATPIIFNTISVIVGGQPPNTPQIGTRDFFSDATAWIGKVVSKAANVVKSASIDVGCGVFASAGTPVFEANADLFAAINFVGTPMSTTSDQDFYLYPMYGTLSHDDNIVVYYNANFPPLIYNGKDAITLGKIIYTRFNASTMNYGDPLFPNGTRVLIHEFTHTTQYKALGYVRFAFGAKYLFQFCKAGFSYDNIEMEVEAYGNMGEMDSLLTMDPGRQFLPIYNTRSLSASIGLPTTTTYSDLGSGTYELAFQTSVMDITCTGASPPICT